MSENIEVLKKLIECEYTYQLEIPRELLCHYTFVEYRNFNPYSYDNVWHTVNEFCRHKAVVNPGYIYVYSYHETPNGNFEIYRRLNVISDELKEYHATLVRAHEKWLQEANKWAEQQLLSKNSLKLTESNLKGSSIPACKFKDSDGWCREDVYKEPVGIVPCEKVEDCFIKDLYNKLALQELKIKELEDRCQ